MTSEDCFVFIAGGGPVGLTLAIDLGRRGIPVILVNSYPETARHPKCNYTHTRTMEHYRRLGIAQEVRAHGVAGTSDINRAVAYRTRYTGAELGRIALTFLNEPIWPGPEYPLQISQIVLEPILKRHAEAQDSVSIRFGWSVVELARDGDRHRITIEHGETGERRQVLADHVVGADGARSFVRRHLDIGMTGEDGSIVRNFVSGTMMSYFIESETLNARAAHSPVIMTWIVNHDARGWIMAQNGRDRFVLHFQVPADVDWRTLKSDEVIPLMIGAGVDYRIISEGPWTGGLSLVADTLGRDGMYLVGDAAHLFTPLGGFGMNTGIGDCMNLGWKFGALYEGWGGPGLLDAYDAERRPIDIRNASLGIRCANRKEHWVLPPDLNEDTPEAEARRRALGDFLVVDDREEYATIGLQLGERYVSPIIDLDLDPDAPPPPDPFDTYLPTDAAGARTPHFYLPDGTSLYDALGEGFGLILFAGADGSALEAAARHRGVPLNIVHVADKPAEFTHDLVLSRPDRHTAWSGDEAPADSLALIDKIRGAR